MKITDPDVIKNGEKDLIDAVKDDLDLDTVKKILEKRMAASTPSPSGGEIIVHNNEIAFKLNFNIQLSGSLMFDRQGNYIPDSDEPHDEKDPLSHDLDLSDIDIEETLEEIGSKEEGSTVSFNEQNDSTIDLDAHTRDDDTDPVDDALEDEDLNIDLPDYSLDDDDEDAIESDQNDGDLLEQEELEQDELIEDDDHPDLTKNNLNPLDALEPSNESDLSDELNLVDEINSTGTLDEEDETHAEDLEEKDLIDDDISDILKESRDFWEQKKDS